MITAGRGADVEQIRRGISAIAPDLPLELARDHRLAVNAADQDL